MNYKIFLLGFFLTSPVMAGQCLIPQPSFHPNSPTEQQRIKRELKSFDCSFVLKAPSFGKINHRIKPLFPTPLYPPEKKITKEVHPETTAQSSHQLPENENSFQLVEESHTEQAAEAVAAEL
jgi:hypothetical protein